MVEYDKYENTYCIKCDKCGYEPDMSGPIPKFCPNCGSATKGGNFCGSCGNKLR